MGARRAPPWPSIKAHNWAPSSGLGDTNHTKQKTREIRSSTWNEQKRIYKDPERLFDECFPETHEIDWFSAASTKCNVVDVME